MAVCSWGAACLGTLEAGPLLPTALVATPPLLAEPHALRCAPGLRPPPRSKQEDRRAAPCNTHTSPKVRPQN